jgi:tRNA-modifying protein YgfZ
MNASMSAETRARYESARTSAGITARTDRALLRVYGRDPLRIIQGIVTNDVAGAPADRAVYAALLTPKGRMIADVRVMRRGSELLLDVPAAALDALLDNFKRTIPPLFARFENVTAAWSMLTLFGPHSYDVMCAAVGNVPVLPPQDGCAAITFENTDIIVLTTQDTGTTGFDLLVNRESARAVTQRMIAAGASAAGDDVLEVLRIEAGTPRWGTELDENTIPLEAGLLQRAISTNKGCYTGQEVIIRVLHRGHVNWNLRGILLGDATPPVAAAALLDETSGKKIGRVTSATWSPAMQQTIALAYVRREIIPPARAFLESEHTTPAHIIALPFPPVG